MNTKTLAKKIAIAAFVGLVATAPLAGCQAILDAGNAADGKSSCKGTSSCKGAGSCKGNSSCKGGK